jgi:hypothetical protein
MQFIPAGNLHQPGELMYSDVLLFIVLAFVVYFLGHYGRTAGWWSYRIYVFGFTTVADCSFPWVDEFHVPVSILWEKRSSPQARRSARWFSLFLFKVLSKKMD